MERFTILRSVFNALMACPPEQMKKVFGMIGRYAMDGEMPEEEEGMEKALLLSIIPLIDESVRRSQAGKRGGENGKQTEANVKQTAASGKQTEATCKQTEANGSKLQQTVSKLKQTEATCNERRKKKEEIKETLSDESVKKGRFEPPPLPEVQEYIAQHGYSVDAERFVDYYTANGWHVGKQPMKDWKAAVRNWNRSQRQELTAKGQRQELTARNKFCDFPQRDYDWDALEAALIQ